MMTAFLIAGLAGLVIGDRQPRFLEWTIDGTVRRAAVYVPVQPANGPAPIVFGFHGHGGNLQSAARSFQIQQHWPEAYVVYMQGLPISGRTDPAGAKPGWQHSAGAEQDRDIKFFDTVLNSLKKNHSIDTKRIYAMGHSNGGEFTYLLWGTHPDLFAAIAPSSTAGIRNLRDAKPCPVLHIAGENDTVVSFASQKLTIEAVRRINGCDAAGMEWAKGCTIYSSSKHAPLITLIHDGDHKYSAAAPELIVRFFKEHSRPTQ